MLTTFHTQTRPAGVELDGVGIVTILNKETGSELLLQKQYRPPIDKVVIEVPAGLIDAGETPEQCAVRELREETGYVGVAEQISPVMYNGITSPSFFVFAFQGFLGAFLFGMLSWNVSGFCTCTCTCT
jgi:8-oxo-dGTP pyrophosphatase MutT (NUDIX family)